MTVKTGRGVVGVIELTNRNSGHKMTVIANNQDIEWDAENINTGRKRNRLNHNKPSE
jgi:hypothetical protein